MFLVAHVAQISYTTLAPYAPLTTATSGTTNTLAYLPYSSRSAILSAMRLVEDFSDFRRQSRTHCRHAGKAKTPSMKTRPCRKRGHSMARRRYGRGSISVRRTNDDRRPSTNVSENGRNRPDRALLSKDFAFELQLRSDADTPDNEQKRLVVGGFVAFVAFVASARANGL